ncbi:hypothetical protein LBMAG57_19110 [Verrucomicrobiota bacterium]|nr:hypothetical protein LBMAG57_19110 [Verrucomicrobiota bacterium]
MSTPNLTESECVRLAESLDPEAQARAAAEREQQGAQHRAEALLRETPHRRALLALDGALAEVQRLVREIMEGAR